MRKDGTRVPILVGGAYLDLTKQLSVGFVLDLSERREAEAERAARRVADLANQAKSEFLANMSHELRTPLNAILGYTELLKTDSSLSVRQRKRLDTIDHSGNHLLALINDILDLARVEAGRLEVFPAPVDLRQVVNEVVDIVRVKAAEKGLALHRDMATDLPRTVLLDKKRFMQVLLNLLSNSVKFTDQGAVTLVVQALPGASPSSESEGRTQPAVRLRIEVKDTGVGMTEADSARVFQAFEQAGHRERREGGVGLGLSISRQLVRAMGGDILVRSRLGEGSEFSFEIDVPVVDAEPAVAMSSTERVGYTGPRKSILVVDDIEGNRAMLRDVLGTLGFDVSEAGNGMECIEAVRNRRPDLIVMDLAMPVMDGCEATRQIRLTQSPADLPILATSAGVAPEADLRSRDAGANAFLPKPIERGRLLDVIGKLMRLTWIDGDSLPPTVKSVDSGGADDLLRPPPEEMVTLQRLARIGNMSALRKRADYLKKLDDKYAPFATRLADLAEGFQSTAIVALVCGDVAEPARQA